MTQLQPIQIDENTIIYIEANESVTLPPLTSSNGSEGHGGESEVQRGGAKSGVMTRSTQQAIQSFQAIESTIRAYTTYTLSAFRQMAIAEIKTVTLEFGVNVAGMSGIPYIATGTAGCNIKVTVECAFPYTELSELSEKL